MHDQHHATTNKPEADATFERAEAALKARREGDRTASSSVRKTLAWYFETRERMQAPNGMHPKTDCVSLATGERARIQVDGGKGGDLDGILADVATIGAAIETAKAEEPMGTAALLELVQARWVNGKPTVTQQAIADRQKVPQRTLSYHVGKAEKILAQVLAGGRVSRD
jgi:hypothetical protein